jgi:hypothetical protein
MLGIDLLELSDHIRSSSIVIIDTDDIVSTGMLDAGISEIAGSLSRGVIAVCVRRYDSIWCVTKQ